MSGEKKLSVEEALQRIDELLNVLNMIARDLRDISKALREGTDYPTPKAFEGAAIFADYTTDAGEWHTWRKCWLE